VSSSIVSKIVLNLYLVLVGLFWVIVRLFYFEEVVYVPG